MSEDARVECRLVGRVQRGKGDASRWLALFSAAYARKVGHAVLPGSLDVALPDALDWFASDVVRRTTRFGRAEYGGERDILPVPCRLTNLADEPARLWTTTP